MKIGAHKIYLPLFIALLLIQLYLPSFKAVILLQMAVLVSIIIVENVKLSRNFFGTTKPFIYLLLLGFVNTIFNHYHFYNISKDIFHFLKPITGLLLGYIIFRRVNDEKLFIKSIVIAGIISSLIHLFIVFVIVGISTSIEEIREFTKDNFLDLFALFFLIYYKNFFKVDIFKTKIIWYIAMGLISFSVVLYFSRTMIILSFLLLLAVHGFIRITPFTVKLLGIFLILGIVLFTYLANANIKRDAKGVEGFLYKIKNAPEEMFKTHVNRENHRDLWDHWRGYEAYRAYKLMEENPQSFIIGTGHGSLVNLKFFAPLSKDNPKGMRYISELHNGYMYIFYKVGIIGVIIYIFALLRFYGYAYKKSTLSNILIASIGLIYIITTLPISGAYNNRDIIILILGAAIYFSEVRQKTEDTV